MKIITKIYIVLLLIAYVFFLKNSIENLGVWLQPITWLYWVVNGIGVFSLIFYAYSISIFSKTIWLISFIFMLIVYGYQFINLGVFDSNTLVITKITILLNYLFLVFPSLLCTAHHLKKHSAMKLQSFEKNNGEKDQGDSHI